jgi:hypothetical protein
MKTTGAAQTCAEGNRIKLTRNAVIRMRSPGKTAAIASGIPTLPTLDVMRRYAVARSLFTPATLQQAIDTLGFVHPRAPRT